MANEKSFTFPLRKEDMPKFSRSFEYKDGGLYLTTVQTAPKSHKKRLLDAGFQVIDTGNDTVRVEARYPVDPPLSLEDALEVYGEEEVYASFLRDWVLSQHQETARRIKSVYTESIPADCKKILEFLELAGIDTSQLSFEEKASKEFLASLIKR